MNPTFLIILSIAIVIGTVVGFLLVSGLLHYSKDKPEGWPHLIIYGLLLSTGVLILFSGRDISIGIDTALQSGGSFALSNTSQWIIRLISIACIALSAERILTMIIRSSSGLPIDHGPSLLLISFALFWLCGTLLPATIAPHSKFQHDLIYPLLFGLSFHLLSDINVEKIILAARDGLAWLSLAGVATLVVSPGLVLDYNYTQGFFPGMPRYAGLTQHAVTCGMATQVAIFCLLCRPYNRKWLNTLMWTVFLLTLVFAQSKTAWTSTVACALLLVATHYRPLVRKALMNPQRPGLAVGLIAGVMLVALTSITVLLFADVGAKARSFLSSSEAEALTSLTGRDRIWEVALGEWEKYPILGYGSELLNADFRQMIGMNVAVHAHNQFIDTLARAGIVGASALIFYLVVLLYWTYRYASAYNGLPMLLAGVIFLRGISEVPLTMNGYGMEFFSQLLLLGILRGAHVQAMNAKTGFARQGA